MESREWRPFFATKEIVRDYEVLRLYWEEARNAGREDLVDASMLTEEDFRFIEREASRSGRSLYELMSIASERFRSRVSGDIASKAFARLGVNLSEEEAAERLAWILAGWLIEASKEFKIIWFRPATID